MSRKNFAIVFAATIATLLLAAAPAFAAVPSSIADGGSLLVHYNSSSIQHSAGNVTGWNDLSGNGNHGVPSSATAPTYNPSSLGGIAAVGFSKSGGSFMDTTVGSNAFADNSFTVFSFINPLDGQPNPAEYAVWGISDTADEANRLFQTLARPTANGPVNTIDNLFKVADDQVVHSPNTPLANGAQSAFSVLTMVFDHNGDTGNATAHMTLYVDGAEVEGSTDMPTQASNTWGSTFSAYIGGANSGNGIGSAPFIGYDGEFAAFLIYDGAMDATEVADTAASIVPEPSSLLLLVLGMCGLLVHRRRR